MTRHSLLLAFVLLLSIVLAGCTPPNAASATTAKPGELAGGTATGVAPTEEIAPTGDETTPEPTEDIGEPEEKTPEPTGAAEDGSDTEDNEEARAGCQGSDGSIPAHAETLAKEYKTTVDVIMGWFCKGHGFGEIKQAYQLSAASGKTIEEIFAMREAGMGWGEIRKELGVKGKQGRGCNPHDEGCEKPGGPSHGHGNGNEDDNND